MSTSAVVAPESNIPIASVKIIRFYYICIACVLTGCATFITGIIGTAMTYNNFAANAGTGIWTSIFVSTFAFGNVFYSFRLTDSALTPTNISVSLRVGIDNNTSDLIFNYIESWLYPIKLNIINCTYRSGIRIDCNRLSL